MLVKVKVHSTLHRSPYITPLKPYKSILQMWRCISITFLIRFHTYFCFQWTGPLCLYIHQYIHQEKFLQLKTVSHTSNIEHTKQQWSTHNKLFKHNVPMENTCWYSSHVLLIAKCINHVQAETDMRFNCQLWPTTDTALFWIHKHV